MRKISQRSTGIPRASRTLSHQRNPRLPHTSIHQLPPIRLPQIQPRHPGIVSPKKFFRIPKLLSELRAHLIPHRIAASPNARPNRRHQILNPRPRLRRHHCNPFLDNPSHRPPPPGMKRRHHPLLHINHEHRNTIRRPHSHQNPRHIGYQSIALQHRLPLRSLKPAF